MLPASRYAAKLPEGESGWVADQRRTLYSYESYILSSAGQDRLSTANYNGIPAAIVSTLRNGFQANY